MIPGLMRCNKEKSVSSGGKRKVALFWTEKIKRVVSRVISLL